MREPRTKRFCSNGHKGVRTRGQLTIEKLKCYPGLETLSDADAEEAIDAITRLSVLLFDLVRKRETSFYEYNTPDAGK